MEKCAETVDNTGIIEEDMWKILDCILDVGEMLLISGAEVNRVENTMQHMATAYGCKRVEPFVITENITITVHTEKENIITQSRRIQSYQTDMKKVENCNALSRRVCKETLPLEELKKEVEKIRHSAVYPGWAILLTYGFCAASFTIFFGGSIGDSAASFLGGLVIWVVQKIGRKLEVQNIVLTVLSSAAAALCAVTFTGLGLGASIDKISIGNIMLLIPGLAFTISIRDIISGDTISGLLGVCEALLRALAIAAGFAIVLWRLAV